jgi:hypothetical protein
MIKNNGIVIKPKQGEIIFVKLTFKKHFVELLLNYTYQNQQRYLFISFIHYLIRKWFCLKIKIIITYKINTKSNKQQFDF